MAELTPERMKEIGESIDLLTAHAKEGDVPWSCYEAMLDLYHAVQAKDASIAVLEKRVERAETRTVEIDERQWTDRDELVAALHRARKGADCAEEATDKLLSALVDMVNQACGGEWLDDYHLRVGHSGLQAYEQAFAVLEDFGRIQRVGGDYVLTWPEDPTPEE